MSYHHFNRDERIELAALVRAKQKQKDIAAQIKKNRTTIWREVKRNGKNGEYDVRVAHAQAKRRRKESRTDGGKIKKDKKLRLFIIRKIEQYWSPEQIAGRLKFIHGYSIICHETIYKYIYLHNIDLKKYLRQKKGKYRRRHGSLEKAKRREEIKKQRIDKRPDIIEKRLRIGDFEGDSIVGKEKVQKILTHVERKSGLLTADKIIKSTADETRKAVKDRFSKIPKDKRHTITYDNGPEFSDYEFIEKDTGMDIYFAFPYHSWERGTNENTNGLLRQFFPKGSLFANITQKDIDYAVSLINNRPRKRHQYRTPHEVFNECCTSS